MQSLECQKFLQNLRKIMQLTDENEILQQLAESCEQLRQFQYRTQIQKMSAYEKRKFNQEYYLMQQNLAKVRQSKIPRKPFSFASRKFIKKIQVEEQQNEEQVQYVEQNLIKNKQNQKIQIDYLKENEDINLQNLYDCQVVLPNLNSVYISNVQKCVIQTDRINSAVHIENAAGCTFELTCHQLRIHNAIDCKFILNVCSAPIIEKSSGILFCKREVENGFEQNRFGEVRDFSWLKDGIDPNWRVE